MNSEIVIELDIYIVIRFIIALLGAALGVFCIILRKKRLENGNVVCSKSTFWVPCLFLLGNPIFMIITLFFDPYSYIEIPVVLIFAPYITLFWINDCITFNDDGFVSTNVIFMKKFYPYSAVLDTRILTKRIVTRTKYGRNVKYVDYAEIFVKQENTTKCKKISMQVDSYNFHKFMRMIDMKRPQLHNAQEVYVGNGNYVKIYDKHY